MNSFGINKIYISAVPVVAFVFICVLVILKSLNVGCENIICHRQSYLYGLQLLLGCTALSVIGGLVNFGWGKEKFRLIYSITVGQVVVVVYIYTRSFFNQISIDIPITRYEIWMLVILALTLQIWRIVKNRVENQHLNFDIKKILIEFLMLFAICVVIADRELPKLIMLSSDPDIHAFFGRQIQRFGEIPYTQHDWGGQAFNYPAGSGATAYTWFLLGYLDVRDAIAALPTLFTYLAALLIAEQMMKAVNKQSDRLIAQFSALTLTAAGLLIPLFVQYSHLEGFGRQISILFAALFLVICLDEIAERKNHGYSKIILTSMVLFLLLVLNPVNIILPIGFLFIASIYAMIEYKKPPIILLASIFGVLSVLLDPYYLTLVGIKKSVNIEMIPLQGGMLLKSPVMLLNDAFQIFKMQSGEIIKRMGFLLAGQKLPLFAFSMSIYMACAIALNRKLKITVNIVIGLVLVFVFSFVVDGMMQAFSNDKRFFLLPHYISFSFTQFKALLLVVAIVAIVRLAIKNSMHVAGIFVMLILLIIPSKILIRSNQEFNFNPRQAYCGSMGCLANEDKKLLEQFEGMVGNKLLSNGFSETSKVLIPNVIFQSSLEKWIFPVSSARVLPHYNVLPAAFYYYQGSQSYNTDSYDKHVCQVLDRKWLASQGINYLFLPTDRSAACISGMDDLIKTEEVVLHIGNAYLLKFRK